MRDIAERAGGKEITTTYAPVLCLGPFSPTVIPLLEFLVALKKPKIPNNINWC
jgi:hypothetical protein